MRSSPRLMRRWTRGSLRHPSRGSANGLRAPTSGCPTYSELWCDRESILCSSKMKRPTTSSSVFMHHIISKRISPTSLLLASASRPMRPSWLGGFQSLLLPHWDCGRTGVRTSTPISQAQGLWAWGSRVPIQLEGDLGCHSATTHGQGLAPGWLHEWVPT